jgi:ubiquinone/menaquinone biosynthesis C-methylase UbiE
MTSRNATYSLDGKTSTKSGWDARTAAYHKYQGRLSVQAVRPLLDSACIVDGGASLGRRVLDVATGPGYGAGEAAQRGARAVGLDLSREMVVLASRNFPRVPFLEGDGQMLPFADNTFDAVTCCFGMPQMPNPRLAIAETHRVLSPGGRFCFSLRADVERDFNKQIVSAAIQAHGKLDMVLPRAAPDGTLRDPDKYKSLLRSTGFDEIEISEVPLVWRPHSNQEILAAVNNGSRSSRLLERQPPEAREKIDSAILELASQFKTARGFEIPRLMMLVSAGRIG